MSGIATKLNRRSAATTFVLLFVLGIAFQNCAAPMRFGAILNNSDSKGTALSDGFDGKVYASHGGCGAGANGTRGMIGISTDGRNAFVLREDCTDVVPMRALSLSDLRFAIGERKSADHSDVFSYRHEIYDFQTGQPDQQITTVLCRADSRIASVGVGAPNAGIPVAAAPLGAVVPPSDASVWVQFSNMSNPQSRGNRADFSDCDTQAPPAFLAGFNKVYVAALNPNAAPVDPFFKSSQNAARSFLIYHDSAEQTDNLNDRENPDLGSFYVGGSAKYANREWNMGFLTVRSGGVSAEFELRTSTATGKACYVVRNKSECVAKLVDQLSPISLSRSYESIVEMVSHLAVTADGVDWFADLVCKVNLDAAQSAQIASAFQASAQLKRVSYKPAMLHVLLDKYAASLRTVLDALEKNGFQDLYIRLVIKCGKPTLDFAAIGGMYVGLDLSSRALDPTADKKYLEDLSSLQELVFGQIRSAAISKQGTYNDLESASFLSIWETYYERSNAAPDFAPLPDILGKVVSDRVIAGNHCAVPLQSAYGAWGDEKQNCQQTLDFQSAVITSVAQYGEGLYTRGCQPIPAGHTCEELRTAVLESAAFIDSLHVPGQQGFYDRAASSSATAPAVIDATLAAQAYMRALKFADMMGTSPTFPIKIDFAGATVPYGTLKARAEAVISGYVATLANDNPIWVLEIDRQISAILNRQ
jgi:hypothetical protein